MKAGLLFLLFPILQVSAADTLFTHPIYPPVVYQNGEYDFYKYTPKYIPENLLHAFKILGTIHLSVLDRFKERETSEVMERGIFDRGYRLRKEFCLESYSPFTQSFHRRGIYMPFAMETYILLAFHQYLRGEWIDWKLNKKRALNNLHEENRSWRKRARHLFNCYETNRANAEVDTNPEVSEDDWFYQW